MKKVIALLLAMIFVLSLTACGGGNNMSLSQLENELKYAHSDIHLSKSGSMYSWSGKVVLSSDSVQIEVKVDDSDNVLSTTITDKGIYNKALSSWDSVLALVTQIDADSNKCTIGELIAARCVVQIICLIDAAANGDSSISSREKLEEVFKKGSCEVNGWKISLKIDSSSDVIVIKMDT